MSYTTLEEEVAQIRGVVNLNYAPSKRHKPFPIGKATENVMESGDMIASLPLRVTGYHFCTDDPKMKFVLNMIRLSHGRHVRVRLRPHFDKHECTLDQFLVWTNTANILLEKSHVISKDPNSKCSTRS
jgi:hypothetical protein